MTASEEVSYLLDEHIPVSVAEELRGRGVDVKTVQEAGLSGALDPRVLDFAESEIRAVVTQDSDFLEIAESEDHPGILFLT